MYEHILKTQHSFARKARAQTQHRFEDLYHLICREDWLQCAMEHVLSNRGARTAGLDGINRQSLKTEAQQASFIQSLRDDLKTGKYRPTPVKRVWIDKPNKRGKRGLGIPIIRDRVVQELLRMLMEPIWESDFLNCSYGFRPGRRTMDCIQVCYNQVTNQNKHFWAIEGDIRKCFDTINHRILMEQVERRIRDQRILKLIRGFLKAGLMEQGLFQDTPEGTPQGGILSPLLANIYLHLFDEWWYETYTNLSPAQKQKRRRHQMGNGILIRYADDFLVLWNGSHRTALALKEELRQFFGDKLHLELSEEKTHVTHLQDGIDFLGFHVQWRIPKQKHRKAWLRVTPTQNNIKRFRAKVKALTQRSRAVVTPEVTFKALNRLIRGWGYYYRYVNFGKGKSKQDYWINERAFIWLQHRHPGRRVRKLLKQFKIREIKPPHNRWNMAVPEESSGRLIFLALMADIPTKRYYRPKRDNPYLNTEEVLPAAPTELALEPTPPIPALSYMNWRTKRAKALKRDQYRCAQCGEEVCQLDAHHLRAVRAGGSDKSSNLQTLCHACHTQTASYGLNAKRVTSFNGEP